MHRLNMFLRIKLIVMSNCVARMMPIGITNGTFFMIFGYQVSARLTIMLITTAISTAQSPKRNRFLNFDGGLGSPVSQQLFIVNADGCRHGLPFRGNSPVGQRLPNV